MHKLDQIEAMSNKMDMIRKQRLSEIDDLLELFQGKLTLDDILDQDYSLISELAQVREEKNKELYAAINKEKKKGSYTDNFALLQQESENPPKSSNKKK